MYIPRNMGPEGNSEELLLILTFSGGGTRAAAFSDGVLEELRNTEVALGGKTRRLSDEADLISAHHGMVYMRTRDAKGVDRLLRYATADRSLPGLVAP